MPDPVRNEMSGDAAAVVQAGSITGGVHVSVHALHAAPSPSRPITEWHPFDLDVHRAVTVGGAGLPDLPAYLPREHDRALAALLAPKRTAMAVLTGESSTGKTRALYEAVTAVLPTWPLVYPRTAEDLLHVLADGVEPGTVLWLNETQNHLLDTHGERAAAALRTLLELPGPFVVVGTLWPQYWSTLTGPNQPQARNLLHHRVTRIRVAKRFTAAQMAAAPTDPRLAKALATAHDGEVVQAVAGGPAVVERYDHPDTQQDRYATAVLTAALDARRLGHHALLTTALLSAAAPGYLSDDDRVDAPQTWFEIGLTTATAPRLGVAALIPARLDPGVGPPDGYHLHDYLDQHGRTTRRRALTPDSLWDALLAHAQDPEDRFRLARNAYHRLRYRHADPLHRTAVATGSSTTARSMLDVLMQHGREAEVRDLLDHQPDRYDLQFEVWWVLDRRELPRREAFLELFQRRGVWAGLLLAGHLVEVGSLHEALAMLRGMPRQEQVGERLAELLGRAGRWEEALEVVRDSRRRSHGWADRWLAERWADVGDIEQLRELAASGVPEAVCNLAAHTIAAGGYAEAVVAELVASGHTPTERLLGVLLDQGRIELAVELAGHAFAVSLMVRMLVSRNRQARAIRFLRDVATKPRLRPVHVEHRMLLADLLADEGRWEEALDLARGKSWAKEWIPQRLAKAGNVVVLRRMADTGQVDAQRALAALLAERGRHGELLDRTRRGDEHCAAQVAALAHAGRFPDSERLLAEGL